MTPQDIAILIDESPMNRGLSGADWVKGPGNRAIVTNGNVMLFEACGNVVEFHWLKTTKGLRQLIRDTREAMRMIFRETKTPLIFGLIPDNRRDSKLAARLVGARPYSRYETPHGVVEAFLITPKDLEGN